MALHRNHLLTLLAASLAFAATFIVLALSNDSSAEPPVPTGAAAYTMLGNTYVQLAREMEDAAQFSLAGQAFAEALRLDPSAVDAEVGLGTVAMSRHRYADALRHARRARRLAPASNAPFTVLVDAQLELGRYDAAASTLQRMVDRKPNLASYARVSYYRELHGDADGAIAAMRLAVSAGGDAPENVAYVQTLLGELLLGRGDLPAARRAYRTALARKPAYSGALEGLAAADAAAGRRGRALARYRELARRYPYPDHLIALGEIELATGHSREARRHLAAGLEGVHAARADGVNVDTEVALVEADHGDPEAAVALARRGYEAAPSVRSADALGWALTRAGKPERGLRFAREALRLKGGDPAFLYHAGVAAAGAGRSAEARRHLRAALHANPRFSVLHAPRARRLLRQT